MVYACIILTYCFSPTRVFVQQQYNNWRYWPKKRPKLKIRSLPTYVLICGELIYNMN